MSGELLLAIDLGTGSCRAVLFSADARQIAVAQHEYTHPGVPGVEGAQEFDTRRNWGLICTCVREALATARVSADAVRAVSASSMREGMVLYDSRGAELWACPNVDARAGAEVAELIASGAAQEIYAHSGDWVSITAPARFRWIARHEPKVFAAIAHIGMLADWILTRLCGEYVTDPSLGSSSGMFELGTRNWSDRILALCELDRSVLPPVLQPGSVVGQVTAAAAAQTGLIEGTPVVVGGADTQVALLGLGAADAGDCTVVGGTFWQQTVVLDQPLVDPRGRLRTLCHTVPGRWMMEGIGFYSGLAMRWFRDAFCRAEVAKAKEEGLDVYRMLEAGAAKVPPGAHGVFGIFSNLMQANRWVHASPGFVGFDIHHPATAGQSECFRAVQESAAYVSRGHLQIVHELTKRPIAQVTLTGGAAKSTLWPKILADALAIPVRVPVVKESTALGAAIYAGVGAGIYADAVAKATESAQSECVYEPDPDASAAYHELYEKWTVLYRRSLELSEAGLVRPMWRAAGT